MYIVDKQHSALWTGCSSIRKQYILLYKQILSFLFSQYQHKNITTLTPHYTHLSSFVYILKIRLEYCDVLLCPCLQRIVEAIYNSPSLSTYLTGFQNTLKTLLLSNVSSQFKFSFNIGPVFILNRSSRTTCALISLHSFCSYTFLHGDLELNNS